MRNQHRQHGLSLIELMIAITLGLVLIGGVINMFAASKQSNRIQNSLAELQDNARFALDTLSYDIRLAGFSGCNSASTPNNASATNTLPNFSIGIQGYEYSADPANDINLYGADTNKELLNSEVLANTDIITVRYASPYRDDVYAVSSVSNQNTVTLATAANLESGTPLIISDCVGSDIFIASTGSTGSTVNTQNSGTTPTFSKEYDNEAEISKLIYRTYFIETGTNILKRKDVRKWGTSASVVETAILEGFEDMQIEYGIDINGNGSLIKYIDASTVTTNNEWNSVSSVRLTLVLSTQENNTSVSTQSYWKADGTQVILDGNGGNPSNSNKKIFRAFTTTIKLRNQGLDS